ncbi:MAG: TIGR03960 family B12-binding radical SAM protein [Clostridia bacterium]|nr:TIGR03960 family B12-binding radical SAM protein [Clostridia bacterium]
MTPKEKLLPFLKNVQKPARYIGGELNQIVKDKEKTELRVAFCFPDSYEIGMSNLGMKILYGTLNEMENVWCERVFAPWEDMGKLMQEKNVPLYALESGDALCDFDIVAFSLSYEMAYTNVLYMLELAGIPLTSKERGDSNKYPLIIAGGTCAYNPEPMADFVDLFSIGEGEEHLSEIAKTMIEYKKGHADSFSKKELLLSLCSLEGSYVPMFYDVKYEGRDGTISEITPNVPNAPEKITKRVISDFQNNFYPTKPVVPYIETVHDRISLESARGCIRGCRFCQAGMVYRPYRAKSYDKLCCQAKETFDNSGYEEISLLSLSISDYDNLSELVDGLKEWTDVKKVGLSLPSMRIDAFEAEIMEKVNGVRKTGLTFAPEAGTQRLRDVINKNLTEEEILQGCRGAFSKGRTSVKLYFMLGLPTETDEDICGIPALGQKIIDEYYRNPDKPKGKAVEATMSVSCFVPKSHTPFQWEAQDSLSELVRKQKLLGTHITTRKLRYNWHEAKVSRLEAIFARGDRRLSSALIRARKEGFMFDGWDEYFSYDKWMSVFESVGIDPSYYANRPFDFDEILPWSHISCGVSDEFLLSEAKKAREAKTTPDCRSKCSACGMQKQCKIHK